MSGSLIPNGKQQYLDANGAPLAGGKVYYYIPYTTTAKNTWQDINLTILNTNPIILDSAGECIAWGSGAYRQQIYDVNDNLIWDQYTYGISPAGSNFISQEEVQTATQGQTVFTLSTITYVPGINSLVVFVNGSKQVTGTNYTETAGNTVTFVTGLNAGDVVDFYASLPATAQNMSNAVTVAYNPPFINSVSTNVQAKLSQYKSVKDFGAKGDGTTDDTTAIQNAINSLSSTGAALFFPVGTYKLTNTITLKPGVSIIGEQKGAWGSGNLPSTNAPGVVFTKNFTTGSVFYSPNTQTIQSVTYENFYILGNKGGAGGSNGSGIEIQLGSDIIFRRVWVNEAPSNGFVIGQGSASYHNYLYNCYAFFCGASGYVVQSDWMRFIDCWADGNYVGIDFPNNAYCGSFAHIERCHFEEFELAAIAFQGQPSLGENGNNNVLHCEIFSRPYTNTPAHGIYFNTGSGPNSGVDNIISGNFIIYQTNYGVPKTGHYGIYVFGGGGVENNIIENNSISGFDEGIVIVSACNQNTIKNNNFYSMNVGISNAGFQTIISENTFNGNTIDLTDTGTYGNIIGNTFAVAPTLATTDFASSNNMGSIGNWTPSIAFGGASTGITYTTQTGRFEKSGKTVTAYATITLSNKGSSTGTATMSLPITAANTQSPGITWVVSGGSGVSGYMFGYVNPSTGLFYPNSASGGFLTDANFTNTTSLLITVTYESV